MRECRVRLGIIVVACALGSLGCDALDKQMASASRSADAPLTKRMKPMKLATKEPGVAISLYGDSLGQTPIILDANQLEWPVTFRVFFEEGQREFTFEEYELQRDLTFEGGDVPEDIAIREGASEKKAAVRKKRKNKLKVNEVKGSKNVNPY